MTMTSDTIEQPTRRDVGLALLIGLSLLNLLALGAVAVWLATLSARCL